NSTGSSNRLRKLSAARVSENRVAACADSATSCIRMRSRFISPTRVKNMRSHTADVSAIIASAEGTSGVAALAPPGRRGWRTPQAAEGLETSPTPGEHQLLDLADRLGRIQPLRAGPRAVHDRVASIELERVLELVQARA